MADKDKINDYLKAINFYDSMVSGDKNLLGSGKKSDDQGKKRRQMDTGISTFDSWNEKEKSSLEVIPTGIKEIDDVLGIGGLPKGKMVELFGVESGGKSYIGYKAIASCQKMGGVAALLDIENAFTAEWARTIGIDTSALLYKNQAMSAESWLQLAYDLCVGGFLDLIMIDSTAALIPQAMLDGVIGDADMAALARALSPAVSKLSMAAPFTGKGGKKTCVIWINQIREKPGQLFGNPETTPGGRALKFYCQLRLDVRRGTIEKVDEEPTRQKSTLTVIKNKVGIPGKKAEFYIPFDSNFTNPLVLLVKYAAEKKIFTRYKNEFRYQPADDGGEVRKTGVNDSLDLAKWVFTESLVQEVIDRIAAVDIAEGNEPPAFIQSIDENTEPPLTVKKAELENSEDPVIDSEKENE